MRLQKLDFINMRFIVYNLILFCLIICRHTVVIWLAMAARVETEKRRFRFLCLGKSDCLTALLADYFDSRIMFFLKNCIKYPDKWWIKFVLLAIISETMKTFLRNELYLLFSVYQSLPVPYYFYAGEELVTDWQSVPTFLGTLRLVDHTRIRNRCVIGA